MKKDFIRFSFEYDSITLLEVSFKMILINFNNDIALNFRHRKLWRILW